MSIDGFMQFSPYSGDPLASESQVDFSTVSKDMLGKNFKEGKLFEIEDFSFDVEQTLNIGSQSTGAGAGKITFNPFSITRRIDKATPILFQNACSGTPFKNVILALRKASGGLHSGQIYLRFDFKLVAVKTISWSYDDESPKETVSFEYGGVTMQYRPQKPDGTMEGAIPGGWNRVKNIADTNPDTIIGS